MDAKMISRTATGTITGTTDQAVDLGEDWAGDSTYWMDVRAWSHMVIYATVVGGTSASFTVNGGLHAEGGAAPVAANVVDLYTKADVAAAAALIGTLASNGKKAEGARIDGIGWLQVMIHPDADETNTVVVVLY